MNVHPHIYAASRKGWLLCNTESTRSTFSCVFLVTVLLLVPYLYHTVIWLKRRAFREGVDASFCEWNWLASIFFFYQPVHLLPLNCIIVIKLHNHCHLIHSAIISHPSLYTPSSHSSSCHYLTWPFFLLTSIHLSLHPLTPPPPSINSFTIHLIFLLPSPPALHSAMHSIKPLPRHSCIHPFIHPSVRLLLPQQSVLCLYISSLKSTFMHH